MKRAVAFSVLLHVALAGLLFIGFFKYFNTPDSANPDTEVIDSYTVEAEALRKLQANTETRKDSENKLKEKLERQRQELAKKVAEEKKLKEQERQKLLEQKRKFEELELRRKQEQEALALEQKRLLEEKKLQEEFERKARLKAEAEHKRQEKLRKEKAEKVRQAKLAEQQRQAAAKRKAQLAAGQAREQAKINSIVSKYSLLIQKKMERNWQRPSDSRVLTCTTKIKLLPDGSVFDVKIIKASGSGVFDGSVVEALYRAGTFPLPSETKYRKLFLEDDLIMKFTNQR